MSRGFNEIDSAEIKDLRLPVRFEMAFGCRYVKSTYNDHRNIWKKVPMPVSRECIAAGQTEQGEWRKLVAKYGKGSARK